MSAYEGDRGTEEVGYLPMAGGSPLHSVWATLHECSARRTTIREASPRALGGWSATRKFALGCDAPTRKWHGGPSKLRPKAPYGRIP